MTSSHPQTDHRLSGAVTPEQIARLAGLDVRARTIVEGFVTGLHRSPQHGFSVEFAGPRCRSAIGGGFADR